MLASVGMIMCLQFVTQLQFLSSFSKLLQSCVTVSPDLIGQMDTLKQLLNALVGVLILDTQSLGQNLRVNLSHKLYCSVACNSEKYILQLLPCVLADRFYSYWSIQKVIPSLSLSSNSPGTLVRASWVFGVIKLVTHFFLLQTQVLGTQFVCAGRTCLCSWLLWWGGIAQQLTHLSLLHWGDAGERSQVCRRSYLCACKGQNLSQCFRLLKFDIYSFIINILMILYEFCKDFSEVVLKIALTCLRFKLFFNFWSSSIYFRSRTLKNCSSFTLMTWQESY